MKKRSRFNSIAIKLILSIGLIVTIICVSLTYVASSNSTKALQDNLNESLEQITKRAADTVASRVNEYYGSLEALSDNELFFSIFENKNQVIEIMKRMAEKEGHYEMMVSDIRGNAFSTKDSIDISQRDYFKKAIEGEKCVSDPLTRKGDDTLVVIYTVPIKNHNDQIVGTISAVRDGYELCDMISDVTYADSGKAFMLTDTGVTVAHEKRELVSDFDNDLDNVKRDAALTELVDIEKRMIAGEAGVGAYTYKGEKKYLGYAPVNGTKWSLALAAPEEEVFKAIYRLRETIIIISALFVIIGIAVSVFVARGFKKPIHRLVEIAHSQAEGNFDIDINIKRGDELGILSQALQTVTDGMNELMSNIKTASEQVATGAKQISDSSTELSQGATEQASSIEELTASIEEISSQTKLNAENAENANTFATEAKEYAAVGNDRMKNMLKSMDDINTSSNSISKIIKVIDDIAFQTNILALNAAVEAARAGEHGKGFAVVAEEVRNLAARSANAAKETTDLIEGSISKVNDGTKIANETAEELKKIVDGVSKVAELVNNIAVASNEQASGISQVNQGIMQVSQVVQENSATSEESAAASEELSGQAAVLEEQISHFKLKNDNNNKSLLGNKSKLNSDYEKKEKLKKPENSDESNTSDNEEETDKNDSKKIKLSLSDNEFGKY